MSRSSYPIQNDHQALVRVLSFALQETTIKASTVGTQTTTVNRWTLWELCGFARVSRVWTSALFTVICEHLNLERNQAIALFFALIGKNIFITGGAGVGKSHITRTIQSELLRGSVKTRVCASTGLAAINVNGTTIHKLLGMTGCRVPDLRIGLYPNAWLNTYEENMACPPSHTYNARYGNDPKPRRWRAQPAMPQCMAELNNVSYKEGADAKEIVDSLVSCTSGFDTVDGVAESQDNHLMFAITDRTIGRLALSLVRVESLIIDEISMVSDPLLHTVRFCFKTVHKLIYDIICEIERRELSWGDESTTRIDGVSYDHEHIHDVLMSTKIASRGEYHRIKKRVTYSIEDDNPFKRAMQIVCVGDFAQLSPVNRGIEASAVENDRYNVYAFQSRVWRDSIRPVPIVLDVSKRTDNLDYVKLLNRMRSGLPISLVALLKLTRPSKHANAFEQRRNDVDLSDIRVEETFAIFPRRKVCTTEYKCGRRMKLPDREQQCQPCVDNWNAIAFHKTEGYLWTIPTMFNADPQDSMQQHLPRHRNNNTLCLRTGSIVQITSRMLRSCGSTSKNVTTIANGMIGTVDGFRAFRPTNDYPNVANAPETASTDIYDFEDGSSPLHANQISLLDHSQMIVTLCGNENVEGVQVVLDRTPQSHSVVVPTVVRDDRGNFVTKKVTYRPTSSQFQVCLANGLTVHKSQGQTFRKEFAVYMQDVFVDGQRYVMLSRASDPKLMRIDFNDWDDENEDWETRLFMADGVMIDHGIAPEVLAYHRSIEKKPLPFFV
jgi:hypothetical protein